MAGYTYRGKDAAKPTPKAPAPRPTPAGAPARSPEAGGTEEQSAEWLRLNADAIVKQDPPTGRRGASSREERAAWEEGIAAQCKAEPRVWFRVKIRAHRKSAKRVHFSGEVAELHARGLDARTALHPSMPWTALYARYSPGSRYAKAAEQAQAEGEQ